MKAYIMCLTLCSLTQGVYIGRMTPISRMTTLNRIRSPSVFRPGINLQSIHPIQRPWNYGSMRIAPATSHRVPFVLYKSSPQRYAIKHYAPTATRNMFAQSPWKSALRLPPMSPVTSEYEFMKAASAPPAVLSDGGTGAIHTIPAPNLSLSEKPIVVIDSSEVPATDKPKPSYEVTEKNNDGEFNMDKIESPIGFSKATSFSTPELQALIRNGAALQLASEFSLPVMSVHQHQQMLPQQFQPQAIANLPSHQDFLNSGAEGIYIPPTALYQSDPMFLQKLQNQLVHRFPAVEFIPYAAEANPVHSQPQLQASQNHPEIVLLENEQLNNTPQTIHVHDETQEKNVVEREAQQASVITLIPPSFMEANITEKQEETTTTQQPQNITMELVAAESQPVTATIKYLIASNSEIQNTTPIYYAQVGQKVGSITATGFYSAINDVRAAAALSQVENTPESSSEQSDQFTTTTTTTPSSLELNAYFLKSNKKTNVTNDLKPLLGVPFTKATDAVDVAYTLVRSDDKQPKVTQEGTVYAGQIVEATISEDQDFNNEKASFTSRRAPIRLYAVEDSNSASTTNKESIPKVTVVQAKISPNTKLTFDDKTGEPILRIYASYVDNPTQKDAVISKLASLKPIKENLIKRPHLQSWRGAPLKSLNKNQGIDANKITQFGLKLRDRSDDYIPLFEDYDD